MSTLNLSELKPTKVWSYFAKIASIPHVSGNEQALSDYLVSFAKEHHLQYEQAPCGNVSIYKQCTPDYTGLPTVILQAHMDMVGVKVADKDFDFAKDPIELTIEEEGFLTANGTTLGADNGIGLAIILAVLTDPTLKHPPLKAIFTVGEETDMVGANALTASDVNAGYVINLDSETLGEICIGCAGGISYDLKLEGDIMEVPADYRALAINISRGTGGHSGIDIDKGSMNAVTALMGLINSLRNEEMIPRICAFSAGTVRNSIPGSGQAIIALPASIVTKAKNSLLDIANRLKAHYLEADPNISVDISEVPRPNIMLSPDTSAKLLSLQALNMRVIERADNGNPLTSCNLGVVKFCDGYVKLSLLARYATATGKTNIEQKIKEIIDANNLKITHSESYPAWEATVHSRLNDLAYTSFMNVTGTKPKVTIIHAGLECGLFKQLNPNLDIISIGPNILGAHSTKECVNISSVDKCMTWLISILSQIN